MDGEEVAALVIDNGS
ncbi:hypothetical protein OXX79_009593, partial [Metschnikowia pulcherrima]